MPWQKSSMIFCFDNDSKVGPCRVLSGEGCLGGGLLSPRFDSNFQFVKTVPDQTNGYPPCPLIFARSNLPPADLRKLFSFLSWGYGCTLSVTEKEKKKKHSAWRILEMDKRSDMILGWWIREDISSKKMFSFGHCPNHLNPHPPNSGNLVLFFRTSKNDVLRV